MKKIIIIEILLIILFAGIIVPAFNSDAYDYDNDLSYFASTNFDGEMVKASFPIINSSVEYSNHNSIIGITNFNIKNSSGVIRNYTSEINYSITTNNMSPKYAYNYISQENNINNRSQGLVGLSTLAYNNANNRSSSDGNSIIMDGLDLSLGTNRVPFHNDNSADGAILSDSGTDPIESNRIPIGNGQYILMLFAAIYALLKYSLAQK